MTATMTSPWFLIIGDEEDWRDRSRCKHAPAALFITNGDDDDDPATPPEEAMKYCNVCPVVSQCLDYAIRRDQVGVWGGTSKYQRDQLKRKRQRAKCPGCAGGKDSIVSEGRRQLCLGCGFAWHMF